MASYENNKRIVLTGKGSGGADELASHLDNANCAYGYVKVIAKDEETTRTKFVFITWKGDNAPVMRKGISKLFATTIYLLKGNMSVHIGNVKAVIKDFSLELQVTDKAELSDDILLKKVKSVNY